MIFNTYISASPAAPALPPTPPASPTGSVPFPAPVPYFILFHPHIHLRFRFCYSAPLVTLNVLSVPNLPIPHALPAPGMLWILT